MNRFYLVIILSLVFAVFASRYVKAQEEVVFSTQLELSFSSTKVEHTHTAINVISGDSINFTAQYSNIFYSKEQGRKLKAGDSPKNITAYYVDNESRRGNEYIVNILILMITKDGGYFSVRTGNGVIERNGDIISDGTALQKINYFFLPKGKTISWNVKSYGSGLPEKEALITIKSNRTNMRIFWYWR